MSSNGDEFAGDPQPLTGESVHEGQEVPAAAATPPAHAEMDDLEDDWRVGHEVAPQRASQHEDSVAHCTQLHTTEEELAVDVAHDVRVRPASSSFRLYSGVGDSREDATEYEEMPAWEGEHGGAASAGSGFPSRAVDVAEHRCSVITAAAARQPTQGTQADAEVDVDVAEEHGERQDDSHGDASGGGAAAGSSEGETASANASTDPYAAKRQPVAPPRCSLPPQAPHGKVTVTVTVLPMGAVTRLEVPVQNPNIYRPTNPKTPTTAASEANGSVAPHWVLVAQDLFESIANHLIVHPQSFRIFHQHQRVRFTETLLVDCDFTSAMADRGAARGVEKGDGGHAEGAVNDRAEPIWVSLTFPVAADARGAASPEATPACDDRKGEGEEAQASLTAVPEHLCRLTSDDYVARCIRVRPRKLVVSPHVLVEGRNQGYSYDEVIHRVQALQDAQQLPASHGGRGEDGANDGAAAVLPNFAIVAILQDGFVAPGKAFLGGYRDKRHPENVRLHASTQLYHRDLEYSPFSTAKGSSANRCTRQTQTLGISRSCQTHREACVQTPRVDLILSDAHDFIVVARPYFTAAELHALRVEMAIIIQKMYRQWKARRIHAELEVAEAARQHRAGVRQRREEALQMAVEDAAQLRRDDPRSAADFERVKRDILKWRADEAACIQRDPSLSPIEIRAALLALTETELQLLQQLDQRRREVSKTQQEKRFVQTLKRMAAPKQWGTVHVCTPETQRAAELRDLYERLCLTSSGSVATAKGSTSAQSSPQGTFASSLSPPLVDSKNALHSPNGTSDSLWGTKAAAGPVPSATAAVSGAVADLPSAAAARLDILLRVKWTVREFSAGSPLTQELCELIDREADLLHRGRKEASLTSLRKRIQSLFAQFIEDPQHNPIAKEFAQTARDRTRVKAAELAKEKACHGPKVASVSCTSPARQQ
ncbi:hypothetical protein LSCM1_02932 [Leishmania martiniquensis]|uniref:IQ motif and ubiquitin-like domain-containing protein n=1 Tax=Leishmania martiniquensis TaxID=1580590 RepID=A0A836H7M4_9TRYP|nr:hypothetical protein LSCM1_02932 [Leishmania martiniquensis]